MERHMLLPSLSKTLSDSLRNKVRRVGSGKAKLAFRALIRSEGDVGCIDRKRRRARSA
jgi:hypothetical protein